MAELSARIAAPSIVRTHGNGNDPRQAAMGLFFGSQAAEPFTLQETITVWYDPGTRLTSDPIPVGNQARIWDTDQATTDAANVVPLNNLTTFYKVFTVPGSLQLYAARQQDYPAIVAASVVIPLWDLFGRNWRRSQLLQISAPVFYVWVLNHISSGISVFAMDGTPLGNFINSSIGAGNAIACVGTEVWTVNDIPPLVARFDFNGNLLGTFTPPSLGTDPSGIVVVGTQVWIVSPTGTICRLFFDGTSAGANLSGNGLSGPINAAVIPVSGGDEVWVANESSWTASRFTPSGGVAGSPYYVTGMHSPFGVAPTDTQAWFTNNSVNTISRLTFAGASAGAVLSGNGLDQPYGIAQVGSSMWVASQGFAFGYYHISRFAFDGTFPDGPLTGNGLNQPVSLTVVPAGNSPIW